MIERQRGSFELIVGGMFAGKTEELIRRAVRMEARNDRPPLAIKPFLDAERKKEFGRDHITSHNLAHYPCSLVGYFDADLPDIDILLQQHLKNGGLPVLIIDEVQFFSAGMVGFIETTVRNRVNVLAAGLISDFRGEPFGIMPQLIAKADEFVQMRAICVMCGAAASRTQRRVVEPGVGIRPAYYDEPLIVIGDARLNNKTHSIYEARCSGCHEVPVREVVLPYPDQLSL